MSTFEGAALSAAQVDQVVSFSIRSEDGSVAVKGRLLRVEHKRAGGNRTLGGELYGYQIVTVVQVEVPGAGDTEFWLNPTTRVEVLS